MSLNALPEELVGLVIDEIDHLPTLRALCIATKGNRYLHWITHRKRWASVTIDHYDILLDPNLEVPERKAKRRTTRSMSKRMNLIDVLVNHIPDMPGCTPASLIRHLVLDFRIGMAKPLDERDAEMPTRLRTGGFLYVDDVLYSLGKLLSKTTGLREVTLMGDLPRELCNLISSVLWLQHIYIRQRGKCNKQFQYPGPNAHHPNRWYMHALDFSGLQRLAPSLKVLEIHFLDERGLFEPESREGKSLALAVKALKVLERLHVSHSHDWSCTGNRCSMHVLVHNLIPRTAPFENDELEGPNPVCLFPETLKSLKFQVSSSSG